MVSAHQILPLAASLLLAIGINAAPIADCGDGSDIETEVQSMSTAVISSTVPTSKATLTSVVVQKTPTPSAPATSPTSVTAVVSTAVAAAAAKASSSASSASIARASSSSSSSSNSGTKYLMVFGDSYSSDGFWAASDTPSSQLPLGIALPGTTTTGGLNWVGMTATELNTSLTFALDYAVYGASTDTSLVRGSTPDLVDQVTEFSTYTANSSDVAWTATNTMAVFWIGINDVGNSYWDGNTTPIEKIHDEYFAKLQILYDAGVRMFTLFTIPPFDQAPVFASESAAGMKNLRSNITAYNEDLTTRLETFKSANSGVTGSIFNTTDSFTTALNSPSTYGATDATCMNSDGTTCLWYDNYHPGQAIHKLVATNFVSALSGTFF